MQTRDAQRHSARLWRPRRGGPEAIHLRYRRAGPHNGKRMPLDDRVIAISATFTAEAIQPGLAFWAGELGLDEEIRFAGYNQVFQQLLDPAGLFARNRGGFNVALVRWEDWLRDAESVCLDGHA